MAGLRVRPGGSAPPTRLKLRGSIPLLVLRVAKSGVPTVPRLRLLVLSLTGLTVFNEKVCGHCTGIELPHP